MLDNARIHKGEEIKKLLRNVGGETRANNKPVLINNITTVMDLLAEEDFKFLSKYVGKGERISFRKY